MKRSQSGQSLIELAFVTPMLLALALGVIELGRYAHISILVGNAARAGAAHVLDATYDGNSASAKAATANAAKDDFQNNGLPRDSVTVTSEPVCACDSAGNLTPNPPTAAYCNAPANPTAGSCATGHWVIMVSVTASGEFNSLFSYPGIPSSITVSRTVIVRVRQ